MFHDKLKTVMKTIDVSAADISNELNCDRSNIFRFLSGKRVPKKDGSSASGLCTALFRLSDKNGSVPTLCALLKLSPDASADEIKESLLMWLYEDEALLSKAVIFKNEISYQVFAKKLDSLMNLAEISNSRLGKHLNIDPSYISRFRNGTRFPKSNQKLKEGICTVLFDRICEQGRIEELTTLTKLPSDTFLEKGIGAETLFRWLYGTEQEDIPQIDTLIRQIETFPCKTETPALSVTAPPLPDRSQDLHTEYFGRDGLKNAVIRFLSVVCENKPKEIFLYSDQELSWILSDERFTKLWSFLMTSCVRNGTKINIIHNIYRDLSEMISSVKDWLQLYPSGMIRSFYSKKKPDFRFSTTLLLCEDLACVSGNNVIGYEDIHGMYRFETQPQMLSQYRQAFADLMEDTGELVKVIKNTEIDESMFKDDSDITVITARLSLSSMPRDTLLSILRRNKIEEEETERILQVWQKRKRLFEKSIQNGYVHECFPLSDEKEIRAGKISADISHYALTYTWDEYAAHIRNLVRIADEHVSFRLCPIPQAVHENTRLRISKHYVAVSRLNDPYVTFLFRHPYLCDIFSYYADGIKNEYDIDKLTAKELLKKYQ